MKRYNDPDTAPLGLHKFYIAWLVIQLIAIAVSVVFSQRTNSLNGITYFEFAVDSVLIIVILTGLGSFELYAWRILMFLLFYKLALIDLAVIISIFTTTHLSPSFISRFVRIHFLNIPAIIYYFRLRPLFHSGKQKANETATKSTGKVTKVTPNGDTITPESSSKNASTISASTSGAPKIRKRSYLENNLIPRLVWNQAERFYQTLEAGSSDTFCHLYSMELDTCLNDSLVYSPKQFSLNKYDCAVGTVFVVTLPEPVKMPDYAQCH